VNRRLGQAALTIALLQIRPAFATECSGPAAFQTSPWCTLEIVLGDEVEKAFATVTSKEDSRTTMVVSKSCIQGDLELYFNSPLGSFYERGMGASVGGKYQIGDSQILEMPLSVSAPANRMWPSKQVQLQIIQSLSESPSNLATKLGGVDSASTVRTFDTIALESVVSDLDQICRGDHIVANPEADLPPLPDPETRAFLLFDKVDFLGEWSFTDCKSSRVLFFPNSGSILTYSRNGKEWNHLDDDATYLIARTPEVPPQIPEKKGNLLRISGNAEYGGEFELIGQDTSARFFDFARVKDAHGENVQRSNARLLKCQHGRIQ
jgi:hypothetical protein